MSISGSFAGAIIGICLGVIVAALKGWNFWARSRFWGWSEDGWWNVDGEAWVVTICLAIIGCIVGGVFGKWLRNGK